MELSFHTPGRLQLKTLILLTTVDQKELETAFSIAICPPIGDKWQSKTLFLAIFDLCSSIVKSVFDCRLPDVFQLLSPNLLFPICLTTFFNYKGKFENFKEKYRKDN